MKLTPEQVSEILEAAKPDIIAGLKEEVVRQAKWDLNDKAGQMVRAEVERFVGEEIVPVIREQLIESKEGLISLAVPLAETIVTELAAKLAQDAKKNMENSWDRKKILDALFR